MLTVRSSEGEDFALGFFSPPAPTRQWHSVAEKHKHTREGEFVQGAWLLTKEDRTGLKRVFDNAARGHHACVMQDHTSKLSLLANFALQKESHYSQAYDLPRPSPTYAAGPMQKTVVGPGRSELPRAHLVGPKRSRPIRRPRR